MQQPLGGKNDIPNRLKRQFFSLNMILPSNQSVDNIYGEIIRLMYNPKTFNAQVAESAHKLVKATISIWEKVKKVMLPTPAKFHYQFNMRELFRVF